MSSEVEQRKEIERSRLRWQSSKIFEALMSKGVAQEKVQPFESLRVILTRHRSK